MKFEHIAMAVPDPVGFAAWYVANAGATVVRSSAEEPYIHFLRLPGGTAMIEVFKQPQVPVPDYASLDPYQGHLAFACDGDFEAEFGRLLAAGASELAAPHQAPDGSHFALVRDPWGIPLQLVKRAQPMG